MVTTSVQALDHYEEIVETRAPLGKITVPGITTQELFDRFGIPYYLKIDIEGADSVCVEALSTETKPDYLSFEISDDLEELVTHIALDPGFSKFKIINQCNFREASNQNNLYDRFLHAKMVSWLGYLEPSNTSNVEVSRHF